MRAIPPRFRKQFPPGSWFDDLPAALLQRLTGYGVTFVFDPGEVLVEEGVPNEWLHVILEGQVQLECADPLSGRPIKVLELVPGCITGERGILYPALPIATARAVTEVTTYRLQHLALLATVCVISEGLSQFRDALRCCIDEVETRRQQFLGPEIRERAEEPSRASRRPQSAANGVAHT